MKDKIKCPFCGGEVHIVVCDDDADIHRENGYEEDPWNGLGYVLIHKQEDVPDNKYCPIATYADEDFLGALIYDTREEAVKIWENNEIAHLTEENAELHARLDKAVELKVNVRDTLYMPWKHNGIYGIATLEILEIRVGDEVKYITDIESDDEVFLYKYKCGIFSDEDFDNMVFTDSAKAEARLAELKGGEGE